MTKKEKIIKNLVFKITGSTCLLARNTDVQICIDAQEIRVGGFT